LCRRFGALGGAMISCRDYADVYPRRAGNGWSLIKTRLRLGGASGSAITRG
jgi:hypothetical protein